MKFFYGWWNFVNRKKEVVRNQRHLFVNNPSSGFKISKLSIRTVPSFGLHLFLHSAWVGRFSGFELWFFISFCSFSLVKLYGITALILSYFSSVKRHFLVMVVLVALTTYAKDQIIISCHGRMRKYSIKLNLQQHPNKLHAWNSPCIKLNSIVKMCTFFQTLFWKFYSFSL